MLWDPLPKRKLPTSAANYVDKINQKHKVFTLKEKCSLLAVDAHSQSEMDFLKYLDYEFSIIPRSMNSVDGELLLCSDKSILIHETKHLSASMNTAKITTDTETDITSGVIIFDGVAVVNQIKKFKDRFCGKNVFFKVKILKKSESSMTNISLTH